MKTALLRVCCRYLCAVAVFTRLPTGWSCTHAAPILRWMVGKQPSQIKHAILTQHMDWEYQWVKEHPAVIS